MSNESSTPPAEFSRRALLRTGAVLGGAGLLPWLSGCSSSSSSSTGGSSGQVLKYWDMPFGAPSYNTAARKVVAAYKPTAGLPAVNYQEVQWTNFMTTFASAIDSKTGPAVSMGGGFQAFSFAQQGAIAYADDVIAGFKKDGTYDDFLPGTVESMKTSKGYAALPWELDPRVWWYRKSLLDQAGVTPPTTWDEVLTVGEALKKIGVSGFATGGGIGNNIGVHGMVSMMINNGGGLFSPDGKVDVVTDRNIEAMSFVKELANRGIIEAAAVSFTQDNQYARWKTKKVAMGIDTPGLDTNCGDTSGDLRVMDPIAGPHGEKNCLVLENNMMMYTNTPSQEGSEAFVSYYFKNLKTLWAQNVVPALPVLKSVIALPAFQAQKQKVKIIREWQPLAKTWAARSTEFSPLLAKVDGGRAMTQFTQTIIGGKTDPKAALVTLQTALDSLGS
jgi:multiple sugar transport system substrate-binding protein